MLGHPLQWDPLEAQQPLVASRSTNLHSQLPSCHPHSSPELSPLCEPSSAGSTTQGKPAVEYWVLAGVQEHQSLLCAASCTAALGCWNPVESFLHSLPVLQVSSREPSSRAAPHSPAGQ